MKYRGIFEYDYPTEHKPPVSIDVHLHGDCVKGKIIEWEYRPLDQEPRKGHWKLVQRGKYIDVCCSNCEAIRIKEYAYNYTIDQLNKEDLKECFECADMRYCPNCGSRNEVEE